MAVTRESVSKMVKEQNESPDIDYGKVEKYPAARKWNEFVRCMEEARKEWESLQEEINTIGRRELENYPIAAQKHLGRFRNVNFEWMVSMFVDYYRGAGGLDSMYIILPPEIKLKGEKENDSED